MKGARPVLRGEGNAIVAGSGHVTLGCGGSLIKTQDRSGGTPAALVKNSSPTRGQ